MLKITLLTLLISVFANAQSPELSNPIVRVRLKSGISAMTLEGLGAKGSDRLLVQRVKQAGYWVWQIGKAKISTEKSLRFEGHNLHFGKMLLPNTTVLVGRQNSFDVVGILPLEDYLVGVLASEMPLSWPQETLKAQAVAARSYSLVRIKERAKDFFDLESTVADQVFEHIRSGPDNDPLIQKAKIAAKETAGMILVSPLTSKVIKAYYHSSCGGRTQDSKTIWGMGPNTGVAVDSYCEQNPKGHWSLRVGVETLAAKLKEYFKAPGLSSLSGLNIAKAGFLNIETLWANQEKKAIAAQDMRAVLGYDKLRSPSFSIKKQGEDYIFEGRGFGHGVGLCQWGARALGKNGAKFDEILMHYYPKAEIKANNRFRLANTKTTSLPELRSAEESSVITEIK